MKFKDDIIAIRFDDMCDLAKSIAIDADKWSIENYGKELTLTSTVSTIEEDKSLNRESDTHRTRRAFDIRTGDLDDDHIRELCKYLRKKYGRYGAINSALPRLIVDKTHGTGPHLHVQLSRKYALPTIAYGG